MTCRNRIWISILILIIIVTLLTGVFIFHKDNYIIIDNKTDISLSGLIIKYSYSDKEEAVELPEIHPQNSYKIEMLFPADFSEGAIVMNYTDKQGIPREEYIVGYIEKGYHGKFVVKVISVDLNGVLSIRVE